MKSGFNNITPRCRKGEGGFTFAEILAAMVFMAIVIPVALEGMSIATRASVYAERKAVAARLADQVLTEKVVTEDWQYGARQGVFEEMDIPYRWEIISQAWPNDNLTELNVLVYFPVQGKEFFVRMTTLVDEEAVQAEETEEEETSEVTQDTQS